MPTQTDVLATRPLTSTGLFKTQGNNNIGRARIKGVFIVCGANAGSVVIADGAGGPTLMTVNTPTVVDAGTITINVPDQGVLATTGLHGTVTNAASVTLFYG